MAGQTESQLNLRVTPRNLATLKKARMRQMDHPEAPRRRQERNSDTPAIVGADFPHWAGNRMWGSANGW